MAAPVTFPDEECCTVYWNIKNFSHYHHENIYSPEFYLNTFQFRLELNSTFSEIEYRVRRMDTSKSIAFETMQISILTCDGSPEESITGKVSDCLKVLKDVIFGNRRSSFLPKDALTVRFRCSNRYWTGKLVMCSEIGVKRKRFHWTFKNLSTYTSNPVKLCENSGDYGQIYLILKCSVEQLSVEISRSGGSKCYYTLKMYVLDKDGGTLNEINDKYVFEQGCGKCVRGFPALFKSSKGLALKNVVLPEDTLSLKCIFTMSTGRLICDQTYISYYQNATTLLEESGEFSLNQKENDNYDTVPELQSGLKCMLDEGTLFDAKLQIGNEVIQVHKVVLSARSPVFKAMFTKDMKESIINTVAIEDLEAETVRRMVCYMYTNTIQDDQWEHIKKLYFAACKYGIQSLKKKCSSFLESNLTITNVSVALVLADLHQDKELKTIVLNFISKYDSTVFASNEWKELEKEYPALVIQAMREIYCSSRFR